MRPILRTAWLWLWGALALGVIVAAVLVSVARLVTPLATEYQAQIEQHLSDYLGFPVAVESLEVEWHVLGPRLRLENLHTGGADPARTPARIERAYVDLALALPSAGNYLPLRIQDVALVGVEARLELGAGGQPSLSALELGGADRSVDVISQRLFGVRTLQLRDARITIEQEGRAPLELSDVEMRLVNDGERHRIAARADLPAPYGDEMRAAFDLRGPPGDPAQWHGTAYASGSELALERWLAPWREVTRFGARGRGDAELWARWSDGRLQRLQTQTRLRDLVLTRDDAPAEVAFGRLAGRFAWTRSDGGWRVDAADLEVARAGRAWRSDGFSLARRADDGGAADWRGHFGFARAEDVLALARLAPLPQGLAARLEDVIGGRAVQGDVRGLRFHASGQEEFAVRATLDGVGWSAGESIPGVSGLDGHLALEPGGGHFELTTDGASVSAPWLFRGPLPIADLRGRIDLDRDAGGMRLHTSELRIANGDVRGVGRGELVLPADAGARIDMQVDFAEGDASAVSRYLPVGIMKPELVEWLDNAFVGGRITQGRMLWRGRIRDFPHHEPGGVFAVDMQVSDGRLDYAPEWPGLLAGAGRVRFEGRSLTVSAEDARLFDSRVTDLHAHIANFENAHLKIALGTDGPLTDLVRVVNESPLQERLGPLFRGAQAGGSAALELDLDIPLRVPEEAAVRGNVRLDGGSSFAQPRFALALDQLDGTVEFTDDSLQIDGLQARLREQPVTIDARTQHDGGERTAVVNLRGTLGAAALLPDLPPWLADRIEGRSPWHIQARVPVERDAERSLIVRGSSDLAGTAVDLPAPLGKAAGVERPLHFELPVDRAGSLQRVRFAYGAHLQAALDLDDAGGAPAVEGGRVRLGGGAVPTVGGDPSGVRLRGRIEELDLAAWSALLRAQQGAASALGDGGRGGIVGADLHIGRLRYGGRTLSEVTLAATRAEQVWRLDIDGPMLAGRALIPHAGAPPERPLELRLDQADLVAAATAREEADAGAPPDPAALPPLDVRIDRLTLPAGVLRQVVLTTTPLADGLAIRRLEFGNPHLSLQGSGYWRGSDQRGTALDLRLRSDDLGAVLDEFGLEGIIERTHGRVTAGLRWPGPPWSPALGSLEGKVEVQLNDGALKSVDPGVARLLAPFNMQGLLGAGFHVEEIDGRVDLGQGIASTRDLKVEGSIGRLSIRGRSNLVERSFDHTIVYRPELSRSLPLIGMLSGGPATGLAVALVQGVLRNMGADVESAAEITYRLTGSWDNPTVRVVNTDPGGPDRTPRSPAGDGAQR